MKDKCKIRETVKSRMENRHMVREILIALCMAVYDRRYLRPLNFGNRIWTIHHCTDYYKVHAPILYAAKHCVKHWTIAIIYGQMPDTFEGLEKAWHYYNV